MSKTAYWPLSFSKEVPKDDQIGPVPNPESRDSKSSSPETTHDEVSLTNSSGSPKIAHLDTIEEASKENSEASSRKDSLVTGSPAIENNLQVSSRPDPAIDTSVKPLNWWFWSNENPGTANNNKEPAKDEGSTEAPENRTNITEIQPTRQTEPIGPSEAREEPVTAVSVIESSRDTSEASSEPWVDWSLHYTRVTSVVGYVYTRAPPATTEAVSTDTTPLLAHTSTQAQVQSQEPPTTAGWFSWLWSTNNPEDTDDESSVAGDDGARELYKSAKFAIENSKESTHYAFKYSVNEDTYDHTKKSRVELAVSDTPTESQPIKYNSKKRPITPNEVQERTLQISPVVTAPPPPPQNLNVPPNGVADKSNGKQTPEQSSSASSIKSLGSQSKRNTTPERGEEHPSFVVPQLDENFRTITLKTKLRLIAEDIFYKNKTSETHLYRNSTKSVTYKKQKTLKKIVIVGVHGFLPIKMVRTMIGQSTGNSIRFVTEATKAVQMWLKENNSQYDSKDYDIQTIALEGEGKINERVDKLFKLLDNWHDIIQQSDFLFFVSHSQGTPVALILLAKLITECLSKHVTSHRRIGLLSMSGMGMGPILGLDTKLVIRAYTPAENEIIGEFFELQKPNSPLSLQLCEAMKVLTKHNTKITFSGAIDDQFIPITSTLANQFQHPNIFRFLYVDKASQTPGFIVNLIKIVVTMKNMGSFNDYRLLKDVGDRFVGTVPDGSHCKIYHDQQVYYTAIKHTLETTNLTSRAHHALRVHSSISRPVNGNTTPAETAAANMYLLPWNVRNLVQDLIRVNNIGNVQLLRQLLQEFHAWEPTVRNWKELKYCLSALDELEVEELVY